MTVKKEKRIVEWRKEKKKEKKRVQNLHSMREESMDGSKEGSLCRGRKKKLSIKKRELRVAQVGEANIVEKRKIRPV